MLESNSKTAPETVKPTREDKAKRNLIIILATLFIYFLLSFESTFTTQTGVKVIENQTMTRDVGIKDIKVAIVNVKDDQEVEMILENDDNRGIRIFQRRSNQFNEVDAMEIGKYYIIRIGWDGKILSVKPF